VTAYGISYAGYAALALTAFDPRITQLVYSNPAHVHSILFSAGVGDPAPWLSDGAPVWDVIERYLIFPRRFVREVEATERFERTEYQRVREIEELYAALGRSDRFQFVAHPNGHQTKIELLLPLIQAP
jgi:hypothetical protein